MYDIVHQIFSGLQLVTALARISISRFKICMNFEMESPFCIQLISSFRNQKLARKSGFEKRTINLFVLKNEYISHTRCMNFKWRTLFANGSHLTHQYKLHCMSFCDSNTTFAKLQWSSYPTIELLGSRSDVTVIYFFFVTFFFFATWYLWQSDNILFYM